MNRQFYSPEETPKFLQELNKISTGYVPEEKKHQLVFELGEESKIWVRLPLQLDFLTLDPIGGFQYVLVLIESGIAVVGFFEEENLMEHKVFRGYLVRKKQGKSQIRHLNEKGKSRAGSRIRLASTLEFFENINLRLIDIFERNRIDKICLSCSKTLWPYFFQAKVPTPFEKEDPRLYKIPFHVPSSNFDQLKRIHKLLFMGDMRYITDIEGNIVNDIKQRINLDNPDQEMDDW
ncbi:hypothetical protein [Pleomorphovibrio marinus]|uniref:hypothetical protein n=1 Tax=Pleomorphovibrio marinus TaxID=2164132 RepID=UPI000E0BFBAC|nr:hypothetical protein [Pleomorphovibrio marinus]